MTGGSGCYIRKIIFSLLILSGLTVSVFAQDKQISGIVNVYRRVTAFGPGLHPGNVTLNNVDSIAPGDTVLLIQMQGVTIDASESPTYGTILQDTIGSPGGYEFLLVQSVNTVTKNVLFRNNILNSFDVKGNVQLIRVPYYNSATVTGKLTAKQWDAVEKTGGVLAMIIGRKLKLNSDIDVSTKGFRGGLDTIGDGICVNSNYSANSLQSYSRTWTNAGYKGEGVANYDASRVLLTPMHDKGQGPHMTGGGGGNGKFGGGGGGANRGKGGDQRTSEKNYGLGACPSPYTSTNGGATVKISYLTDGLFFGGGGGASTHASGSTGSSGGNGGGIVIIIADTISGNGKYIRADGETAGNALLDAGTGGGGGGGSVILSVQNYSKVATDSLKISASGGNGGLTSSGYGEGGGGGGGLIWVNNSSIPGKVPVNINYGNPGPAFPPDGIGQIKYSFTPKLNGFLFNSIRSEVTGNQIDSICSNVSFGNLSGTIPVGGNTPYTFLWQNSTTSEFFGYTPAPGTNNQQNYTPPAKLTQTTWFRRVVTDFGATLTDTSKAVKIIVQPFIKNNIVGTSDTICFAQDPPSFTSKATLADGNGKYTFKWQVSVDSSLFNLPVNAYTTSGYTPPPALTSTSWYRRTVTSGRCVDSTAIVKITVLDTLKNNKILSAPQDICFGMLFTDLIATTPVTTPALAGGDNSYRFKWESNINGAGWGVAPGVSNSSGYNPTELAQRSPMNEYYFRRVVSSGMHDVCVNTSAPILLRDYPVVTNNTITASQTICSGSAPENLIGSTPSFGNLSYTYTWQDSSKSHTIWTDIPGFIKILASDYQPPVLTDTTSYRRIVFSSACSDTSNSVKIKVHKPILNNLISLTSGGLDTAICNGAVPHILKGTIPTGGTNIPDDYAYLWFKSTNNLTWDTASVPRTGVSYQPPSLSAAIYYYKRQVISGACIVPIALSATISITSYPLISNNSISGKTTVCYNTVPTILTGSPPSGGAGTYSYSWIQSADGITWTPAALVNNTSDYQPPAITVLMKYRRIVKSGSFNCCSDTSGVFNISIDPLPIATITNTVDTTICGGSGVELKVNITGTATPWKITYSENAADGPLSTFAASSEIISILPQSPVALNTYTYLLSKVEDNNGCVATSLTGTKKAYVYRIPIANAGPDADTCGAKFILKAVPSVGTGTWYFPSAVVASTPNNPSVTVTIDSTFAGGSKSLWFNWEEVNWQCKNRDSVKVTFNKRVSSINAGPDTTLYSFDNIFHMVAHKPNIWETGKWTLISGTGSFTDDTDTSTVVENLSKGVNSFKWTVTNGTCQNEDLVNISVFDIFIPEGFSPNGDKHNDIFIISGLDLPNQDAEFKVVNGAGAEVFSTSNINGNKWIDWDGKNSQGIDLPEGTYYYLLKIISDPSKRGTGQVFKKSGFIILKRY